VLALLLGDQGSVFAVEGLISLGLINFGLNSKFDFCTSLPHKFTINLDYKHFCCRKVEHPANWNGFVFLNEWNEWNEWKCSDL